jgi:biopolymer transport protein ExbD
MLLQRQLNDLSDAADTHLDMTPMVDVVFQMLTFLLLTYTPTASNEVVVPIAKHGVGVEQTEAFILTVARPEVPGGPARVFPGDQSDPESQLTGPEAIKQAVTAALDQGVHHIILQADGGVAYGEVLQVASAASEVQGITLHVGVREPE